MVRQAKHGTLLGVGIDEAAARLRRATRSVEIATPFLSYEVARQLARAADEGGAPKRRMLTALKVRSVEDGYLDPEGLEEFLAADFEIYSLLNLHAKVILADRSWGLIGSGNLTGAGLGGGNAELGIVLSPQQSKSASQDFFGHWWKDAEPLDVNYLHSLKRRKRRGSPQRHQRQGRGGIYHVPESRLPNLPTRAQGSGYWLKLMYSSAERAPVAFWRKEVSAVFDAHAIRKKDGQPTRRPSYRVGDLLVIYLARGPRKACPAILRVTAEPVFAPKRKNEGGTDADARWGWRTSVTYAHAVRLDRAPSLDDLHIDHLSVRQHSHIALTPAQFRRARVAIR